jgi:hypothetical protein
VIAEVTEGGGESMKPPDWAGGVDIAVLADQMLIDHLRRLNITQRLARSVNIESPLLNIA